MGVHRFQADTQLEGHITAAGALANHLQDLPLAGGQRLEAFGKDGLVLGSGRIASWQQHADLLHQIVTGSAFVNDCKQHRRQMLGAQKSMG